MLICRIYLQHRQECFYTIDTAALEWWIICHLKCVYIWVGRSKKEDGCDAHRFTIIRLVAVVLVKGFFFIFGP